MPNVLNANGLQTATQQELVTYYTTQYQNIYGPDIDLSSNTPDGQMMNIQIQTILDLQDLLVQIYNFFDPDNAIGNVLDQRVAINGIQRQGGTYTVTPVSIVTSQTVTLYGLDQIAQPVYTVSDGSGNQYFLLTTQVGLVAGTYSLSFRAASPGAVLTIPNTITTPVTIVIGVVSVNNPSAYTTLGQNEESDSALRIRRQQSIALASQGYYNSLKATLENVPDVSSAFIYENYTSTTNADGVPGHSIWVIIAGSGTPQNIATAIYQKRNAGCGMRGSQSYNVTQADGSLFTIFWDDVVTRTLFVFMNVISINGSVPPNIAAIRPGLVTSLIPGVYQEVNINEVSTAVQVIDANTCVVSSYLTMAIVQTFTFSGTSASGSFVLGWGPASTTINWNDSISTIQTKVQAMSGLSSATVIGSISSSIVFNLTALSDVPYLFTFSSNTLQTSAPASVTITPSYSQSAVILPPTKQNQFILESANIVLIPMQLSPSSAAVAPSGSVNFSALGGYGTYVYSLQTNSSGGSINASTGHYVAGVSTGTDVVLAVDGLGNSVTANVVVST